MVSTGNDREVAVELSATQNIVFAKVDFDPSPKTADRAGLLYFSFHDDLGEPVEPTHQANHSKKYGWFEYIHLYEGQTNFTTSVPVPPGAATIRVGVSDWAVADALTNVRVKLTSTDVPQDTSFDDVSSENPVSTDGMAITFSVEESVAYEMHWRGLADEKSQALFLLEFVGDDGDRLLPSGAFPVHPELGPYMHAVESDGSANGARVIEAPPGAKSLRIRGRAWKGTGVSLISRPTLTRVGGSAQQNSTALDDWLSGVESDSNVLIIHTTASALRASNSLLLRSNRMALEMAERGWKVLFVPFSGFNDPDTNWLVDENVLQLPGETLPRTVSSILDRATSGKRVYVCSSRTDIGAIAVQDRLRDHGWTTVYEIRDDMEEFQRVGYSKWYRAALEQRFAKRADSVVATSPRLHERISVIAGRSDVTLIPNAAPDGLIASTQYMRTVEHFHQYRARPVVGYLGHLTASWFDWTNLLEVMRQMPDVRFEIVGHGMPDGVRLPVNAKFLGSMSHEEVLPVAERWRVGLIPFTESRLTYGVDPNKLYEYVAMGLQTVSSPMGNFAGVPGVHVYRTLEQMKAAIADAAGFVPDHGFMADVAKYLETASWTYRTEQFAQFIEGTAK